MNTRSFYSL
ncbi:unnamed protein product [Cryptosporidium hominis]|uniref:Uncharacterized protein n=1 Tax=Cryptosporidium hominis TaxID=237895 RepID=A0A0S4TJV7_CRYHO|nr:unnamed protein product [Cryptosporidium hominis]